MPQNNPFPGNQNPHNENKNGRAKQNIYLAAKTGFYPARRYGLPRSSQSSGLDRFYGNLRPSLFSARPAKLALGPSHIPTPTPTPTPTPAAPLNYNNNQSPRLNTAKPDQVFGSDYSNKTPTFSPAGQSSPPSYTQNEDDDFQTAKANQQDAVSLLNQINTLNKTKPYPKSFSQLETKNQLYRDIRHKYGQKNILGDELLHRLDPNLTPLASPSLTDPQIRMIGTHQNMLANQQHKDSLKGQENNHYQTQARHLDSFISNAQELQTAVNRHNDLANFEETFGQPPKPPENRGIFPKLHYSGDSRENISQNLPQLTEAVAKSATVLDAYPSLPYPKLDPAGVKDEDFYRDGLTKTLFDYGLDYGGYLPFGGVAAGLPKIGKGVNSMIKTVTKPVSRASSTYSFFDQAMDQKREVYRNLLNENDVDFKNPLQVQKFIQSNPDLINSMNRDIWSENVQKNLFHKARSKAVDKTTKAMSDKTPETILIDKGSEILTNNIFEALKRQ